MIPPARNNHIVYLKCLDKLSAVSFPHQNKEKRSYQYTSANNFPRIQFFRLLSGCMFKTPNILSFSWKGRDTSSTHSWWLSKHFATVLGNLKECDSSWSDAFLRTLIEVKTFGAYLVNCDLINNKNSKRVNLATCTVNVLCQLWGKYCIVKLFMNV